MMKKAIVLLTIILLGSVSACRTQGVLRTARQDTQFRERFVGKPYYTAMVLRPYEAKDAYIIDLTNEFPETTFEAARSEVTVPLGTPITVTDIERHFVLARIDGYTRPFHIVVRTEKGSVDDLAEELSLLLTEAPPLQSVRAEMQPFIQRQEVAEGMSRREVFMSWGQPDRVTNAPGASGYLEEWIYFNRRTHLFLHNGYVTNWQHF